MHYERRASGESPSREQEALAFARRVAALHPGDPLIVYDFAGMVAVPSLPILPGSPVLELYAQSDGLLAVSNLRGQLKVQAKVVALFRGPFTDRGLEVLDAWVTATLGRMQRRPGPRHGKAVA